MKKEVLKKAANRVKKAYGIESLPEVSEGNTGLNSEPVLDLESIRHQRVTDRIMTGVDIGLGIAYGSSIVYVAYRTLSDFYSS